MFARLAIGGPGEGTYRFATGGGCKTHLIIYTFLKEVIFSPEIKQTRNSQGQHCEFSRQRTAID